MQVTKGTRLDISGRRYRRWRDQ